jgi:BASS family bile acid:Na+ symporter
MEDDHSDPRVPLARERTELAHDRSRWAAERTLLAWVRSSLAMVTFGFTLDKFFAYLHQTQADKAFDRGAHWLGLTLVCVGAILLAMAIGEHLIILKRLGGDRSFLKSRFSLPLFGGSVVLLLSLGALLMMLFEEPWMQ